MSGIRRIYSKEKKFSKNGELLNQSTHRGDNHSVEEFLQSLILPTKYLIEYAYSVQEAKTLLKLVLISKKMKYLGGDIICGVTWMKVLTSERKMNIQKMLYRFKLLLRDLQEVSQRLKMFSNVHRGIYFEISEFQNLSKEQEKMMNKRLTLSRVEGMMYRRIEGLFSGTEKNFENLKILENWDNFFKTSKIEKTVPGKRKFVDRDEGEIEGERETRETKKRRLVVKEGNEDGEESPILATQQSDNNKVVEEEERDGEEEKDVEMEDVEEEKEEEVLGEEGKMDVEDKDQDLKFLFSQEM